jgi:hypothetical protein
MERMIRLLSKERWQEYEIVKFSINTRKHEPLTVSENLMLKLSAC